MLLYLDTILYSEKHNYMVSLFKFAVTIIKIQFTFLTVASGCLYFVMSMCISYVCIVSLCVFACNSTCALSYTEDMFIDELQIYKATVYLVIFTTALTVLYYKALYKCCILHWPTTTIQIVSCLNVCA